MITTPDGFGMIEISRFRQTFAADLPPQQVDFMANSQVLTAPTIPTTPVKAAGWKTKPTYAIIAGADRAISPDLERYMYERASAETTYIRSASHVVYISHPNEVATVIGEAASR